MSAATDCGTVAAYNRGCSCAECRAANAAASRRNRAARQAAGAWTVHGYSTYTDGCRCDVCRAAKADYVRERRRAGRAYAHALSRTATGNRGNRYNIVAVGAERALVDGITHGRYGYEERGCRCLVCTAAHSQSYRSKST